jgi:hypothetical protein
VRKQIIILIGLLLFFGSCRKTINKTNPELVGAWVNVGRQLEIVIDDNGKARMIDYNVHNGGYGDFDYNMHGKAFVGIDEDGYNRLTVRPTVRDKISGKKKFSTRIATSPTVVDTPLVYNWTYLRSPNTCDNCTTYTFLLAEKAIWYKIE